VVVVVVVEEEVPRRGSKDDEACCAEDWLGLGWDWATARKAADWACRFG
jgi:hypothetical protein